MKMNNAILPVTVLMYLASYCYAQLTEEPDLACQDLMPGQYYCDQPEIDVETQQARNCSQETRTVAVPCYPVEGIRCDGKDFDGETVGFYTFVPCKWTNGKEFSVALLLSVFLGWCGVDRFYLGYPAIGLAKLCTVGFMMLGSFFDLLLIAIQVVGPADGSDYIIDYYGAGLEQVPKDNYTYIKPPVYTGG